MLISQPEVVEKNGEVSVSARINMGAARYEPPEIMWFRFPLNYRNYITSHVDGFLVGLLPSAMALGENIIVEGVISPRLAYGIREYQRVLSAWWPKQYKIIDIEYLNLQEHRRSSSLNAVGSSFSGGVDSFYTLWKHLPGKEELAQYRITHCLMINGFDKDVDPQETGIFRRLHQYYEPMMNRLGISLLTSRTNLQQFRLASIDHNDLHQSFGAAITASVLVLGNLFSRYYIPASHAYSYETLVPMGAHPVLDHLLSTERLQIMHDGAEASRTDKIATIAQWPETYPRLRVCLETAKFQEPTGQLENCCRCLKCLNTMISLDLLNMLPAYSTFPQALMRHRIWTAKLTIFRYHEHLALATRQKRIDRMIDLYCYFALNIIVFGCYSQIRAFLKTLPARNRAKRLRH
jgi:hypothetical protein